VLDGRDIGTIVFPDAPVKLFVTASAEARGRRRWLELRARGAEADLAAVTAQVRVRDQQDRDRTAAPLVAAPDAVVLDTTHLDAGATFARALELIGTRLAAAEMPPNP
jgi:cytidylate kinase